MLNKRNMYTNTRDEFLVIHPSKEDNSQKTIRKNTRIRITREDIKSLKKRVGNKRRDQRWKRKAKEHMKKEREKHNNKQNEKGKKI